MKLSTTAPGLKNIFRDKKNCGHYENSTTYEKSYHWPLQPQNQDVARDKQTAADCTLSIGMFINDVPRFLAIFDLPTYLITFKSLLSTWASNGSLIE